MAMEIEKQNRLYASISTGILFLLMMLVIFFIKFYTPIPPFPEHGDGEVGFEVNFGNTDNGSGENYSHDLVQNDHNQNVNTPDQGHNNVSPDKNVITGDDPENHYVKSNPKDHPKSNTPPDQQPDKNLQNAFNNFNDKNTSDGDKDKQGNEGNPNGGDSKNYDGNSPTGTGGTGHDGNGNSKGPKVTLKGRIKLHNPDNITDFSEEGIIYVVITVDKDGKVIAAEVDRSKSINPDYVLCSKARLAAFATRFNASPDGRDAKGSIIFEFSLK